MIDLKKAIYDILRNSPGITAIVGDEIHTWADGKDIRENFSEKFPQVTYQRVGSMNIQRIGVRSERYQISSWAETQREADTLSSEVVKELNRSGPITSYKSCNLIHIGESYDPETKTFGIHTDFEIVVYDPEY